MIEYTIEAAEKSNLDDWFVFTDKYFQYKTLGIHRPPEFSHGEYNSVVKWLPYAIEQYGKPVEHICLLQPTSPLRTCEDINNALNMYDGNSLVSGYYMRIKSDDVDHKSKGEHFQRNGAIFMFNKRLIATGKLWDNPVKYEMPKSRSVDVDDMDDLHMAEGLMFFYYNVLQGSL
jgi:CMP-N-acetylneuraminic acid synthetase